MLLIVIAALISYDVGKVGFNQVFKSLVKLYNKLFVKKKPAVKAKSTKKAK